MLEQLTAGGVAKAVVDRFEAIQAKVEQRQAVLVTSGMQQKVLQRGTIGQAGQWGAVRLVVEGVWLVRQAFYQLADGLAQNGDLVWAIEARNDADLPGAETVGGLCMARSGRVKKPVSSQPAAASSCARPTPHSTMCWLTSRVGVRVVQSLPRGHYPAEPGVLPAVRPPLYGPLAVFRKQVSRAKWLLRLRDWGIGLRLRRHDGVGPLVLAEK